MEMGRERRGEEERERGRLGAAKRACNEDSVKGKLGRRRRRVFVAVWWVYVCVCVYVRVRWRFWKEWVFISETPLAPTSSCLQDL